MACESMVEKKVSVIIPCYNGEKFLGEAIESVLSQSYQNFEIIVVDDGSSDDTKTVVLNYPRIRYIHQQNQGSSVARNKGMAESKGDYLVFLDHDDRLLSKALEVGVSCLDNHTECGYVFGWYQVINAEGVCCKKGQHRLEQADYTTILKGKALVPPGSVMFRRTAVESVDGFTPFQKSSQDYDIYLKISRNFPIHCHNQICLEYRRHSQNTTTKNGCKVIMETNLKLLDQQRPYIKGHKEYDVAYRSGKKQWKKIFGAAVAGDIVGDIKSRKLAKAVKSILFLLKEYPQGFIEYANRKIWEHPVLGGALAKVKILQRVKPHL